MPAKRTKLEIIGKLLSRYSGATITQMQAATGWQPHSIRAALSGLRKKGAVITRSTNTKGNTVFTIEKSTTTSTSAVSGRMER